MSNHVKGMTSCRPPEKSNESEIKSNESEMDLINRQAAIDTAEAMHDRCDTLWNMSDSPSITKDDWSAIIEGLKALPSVQPEPCEDAVSRNAIIQKLNTMDRYVSEELVLCDTDKRFPKNEVFIVDDVYEEIVENLPSAQPEDCDTCKHGYFGDTQCDNCRVGYPSHYERRTDE